MTRSNFLCVAGIAIAGMAACLIIRHRLEVKLSEGERLRIKQEEQLAVLTTEQKRLSSAVPARQRESRTLELSRLRQEAEVLKAQTNLLAEQAKRAAVVAAPASVSPPVERSPEFYQELRKLAGDKSQDALRLALGFTSYASDHDSQSPANLDQLYAYMAKKKSPPLSGNNQFELVYQGSLEKLKGVPFGTIAVVREKGSWLGPDGMKRRVYGMAGGSCQMVESNDDFKSWEAEHLISP